MLGDRRATGHLLERGGVRLGDAVDPVLPLDELACLRAHRGADSRIGERLERGEQHVLLALVHRHLQHRVAGELREPADVADDERLAQRERPDRAPGGLAHRRRAQGDDRVAGRHQRPELVLGDVVAVLDALRELEAAEPHGERADEKQPRVGTPLAQAREGGDELGDALGLVQVAEAAVQRVAVDTRGPELRDRPSGVWDPCDRAGVARLSRALLDIVRMDDQAGRMLEHLAREREVLGTRLPQRRQLVVEDGVGEQAPDEAALPLHCGEVARRVAARERQADDEVVEDEVVEDDDAGARPKRLDDPAVRLGVVADVVEGDVRSGRLLEAPGLGDYHVYALLQLGQEERRVVGDSRPRGRHRRVVGDLHAATAMVASRRAAA